MRRSDDRLVAVLLGTDHHPFPRLLSWVESRASDRRTSWFVQHGSTPRPTGVESAQLLPAGAMVDLLTRADAVVTHGGPGLIMDAIAAGHQPLVVPRRARLGEHVDDHQVRFAGRMAESGAVVSIDDTTELDAALHRVLSEGRRGVRGPQAGRPGNPETAARFGRLVDDLVRRA